MMFGGGSGFGKSLSRAVRGKQPGWLRGPAPPQQQPLQPQQQGASGGRPIHSSARVHAAPAAGGAMFFILEGFKNLGLRLGPGMVLGSGALVAWTAVQAPEPAEQDAQPTDELPWVRKLADAPGIAPVLSPGQQLRKHAIAKHFVEQDHLFETMSKSEQVKEFRCFYDKQGRKFHSVVHLGKDVCGYPATVHGGMTAAIMDETLGGLSISLWRSGTLGIRSPAYTARLEVDYKQKIPANSVILITAELESIDDRKIWMRAKVTNGSDTLYATGRALFVSPRPPGAKNLLSKILPTNWLPGHGSKGSGSKAQHAVSSSSSGSSTTATSSGEKQA